MNFFRVRDLANFNRVVTTVEGEVVKFEGHVAAVAENLLHHFRNSEFQIEEVVRTEAPAAEQTAEQVAQVAEQVAPAQTEAVVTAAAEAADVVASAAESVVTEAPVVEQAVADVAGDVATGAETVSQVAEDIKKGKGN